MPSTLPAGASKEFDLEGPSAFWPASAGQKAFASAQADARRGAPHKADFHRRKRPFGRWPAGAGRKASSRRRGPTRGVPALEETPKMRGWEAPKVPRIPHLEGRRGIDGSLRRTSPGFPGWAAFARVSDRL